MYIVYRGHKYACAINACGRYPGSYERFLELKEERMHAEGAARDSARNKLRGELAWMRKQPKARQAKSKAREERFFELKSKVRCAPPARRPAYSPLVVVVFLCAFF